MKLIVGLGNPGKEYKNTRHNSGYMAMERIADTLGVSLITQKWNSLLTNAMIDNEKVILVKPLTYMNDSGSAVSQIASYYQIEEEDILIIHDDMDLPTGALRIRPNGSSGGQKGMESIIKALGTNKIARIRVGVGHSEKGNHAVVPDWVLSPVPKAEKEKFEHAIDFAAKAAIAWVSEDMNIVMSKYNIRISEEERKSEQGN